MTQSHLIDPHEDHERMREFEVDRTPYAVACQGVGLVGDFLPTAPQKVLDPCAGDGVFLRICRERWPDAKLTAVEPREEERYPLGLSADRVIIETLQDAFRMRLIVLSQFDVIVTNPTFKQWPDLWKLCMAMLSPGGILCFYGLSTWGHSDEPSEAGRLFDIHPPAMQARVMGRVRHRIGENPRTGKKYGTDSRKYSFWLWRKFWPGGQGWMTINLPRLDRLERTRAP